MTYYYLLFISTITISVIATMVSIIVVMIPIIIIVIIIIIIAAGIGVVAAFFLFRHTKGEPSEWQKLITKWEKKRQNYKYENKENK